MERSLLKCEATLPAGSNFTPAGIIYRYAQLHGLQVVDRYGTKILNFRGVSYKYSSYDIKPAGGCDIVTVWLEPV